MSSYTTSDFLASVRNRGNIPTTSNSNNVNGTANLLRVATEELHIKLVPMIMGAREEFYVTHTDYAITADQAEYEIPLRSMGMTLRDVQVVEGTQIRSLPPIDSEQVETTSTGPLQGYYIEHNNVILYPAPQSTAGTLRLRYFARPSALAATSDCAQISSVDTVTGTITVSTIPSSWTANSVVDFVRQSIPHNCSAVDQTPVSVVGTTLVFATLPAGLAVGDWVALSETTPIPQLPREFQPVLAQMTVVKVLEANGDKDGAMIAGKDFEMLRDFALKLIQPRVVGERKKIVPRRWR